ncbi:hypothetical protein GMLC_10810 [Geomonas limicola]|uniref:Uncharacterized protein n=1 Tax=Geomonas limicola TaxID=2740186 RepID=A0A6V8N4K8_9BACT|nr:hypothetical protein [Geomonas limicola]GFO67502.1 hypothetical protein GMLC_10810 [Geomonas limicola]
MAKKGSNGIQEAEANYELVKGWVSERNARRDWDEYAYAGRINRSALASELDIAKSVMTQNPKVRTLLEGQDKLWFGSDALSRDAAQERAEKRSQEVFTNNNQLIKRIAELEVEVRELRKEVAKHQSLEALVLGGFPGHRL